MYLYILIFLITVVLAFSYNREGKHVSLFFFFSVAILLGLFVACSDMLGGYDRYIYSDAFTAYAERAFLMILFNYISIMNLFLALLWLLLESLQ